MLKNSLKLFITGVALAIILSPVNASYAQKSTAPKTAKTQTSTLLPTKEENKNVLGKFFVTMMWVFGSCAVIYLVLFLYKRRKEGSKAPSAQNIDLTTTLDSPQSVEDAVDFVIKKF